MKGQKQKKDQEKGQTMEDISRMVTELNSKIEAKREIIEPLLNRVRYIYEILHLLKYIRDVLHMYDYAKINQNGDKRHYDDMNINIDDTV